MTYSSLMTLTLIGLTCIALWLLVRLYTPRNTRGAAVASRKRVLGHQCKRRSYMLCHGGLPVDMRRVGE